MSGLASRCSFLRGLTALPLVGGSLTLIGAPSVVAEPVTDALRRLLCRGRYPDSGGAMVADLCRPSSRAALALGAVSCDWRCEGDLG